MRANTNSFQNLSDSRNNSTPLRKAFEFKNKSTQTRIFYPLYSTSIKDSSTGFEIKDADDQKMLENLRILDGFKNLKKGWNDNNAEPFDLKLIEKVKSIIHILNPQPDVFHTGCNSIQLEYEMENGNYLEFEIFADKIKVFQIIDETYSTNYIIKDEMSNYIKKFYAPR